MEDIISKYFQELYDIHGLTPTHDSIFIKIIPVFQSEKRFLLFIREMEITKKMGENRIGPLVIWGNVTFKNYDYNYGILLMEKLDGTLAELWQYIGSETREKVKDL
jgi:hypothetical protein